MASLRHASLLLSLTVVGPALRAQQLCLEPSDGFHVDGVMPNPHTSSPLNITGIASFDDGSGPALFVSGVTIVSAGSESIVGLAMWDGARWSDTGVTERVDDIAVFDDGGGAKLYVVTGTDPRLSTWNGAGLTPLAEQPNGPVTGLDVIDLGSGPELYASGTFTQIGSTPALGIARWNGTQWTAVPNGVGVRAPLEAFDDGSGLELYGISYTTQNCQARVRRLDGSVWTDLGGLSCVVFDFQVHDDGSGSALYLAGGFATVAGLPIAKVARWNGASWSSVGAGIGGTNSQACALASFDDGSGTKLYAAVGRYDTSEYALMRWNGASWQGVGAGLGTPQSPQPLNAMGGQALATFDGGSGERLVVAGDFQTSGSATVWNVASWDGATLSGFGASGQGAGGVIRLMKYLDDGSGPALYAGGDFRALGNTSANRIARWNGSAWSALGAGIEGSTVEDIELFDDGNGTALYAAGSFTSAGGFPADDVARWDGAQWSALGAGPGGDVYDLLAHGNLLYAATNTGLVTAWNGTSWTPVGGSFNDQVHSLAAYDGALFAAGAFSVAGGAPANGIARCPLPPLPSGPWESAGTSLPFGRSLVLHDDGGGTALFALSGLSGVNPPQRFRDGAWTTLPTIGAVVNRLASVELGLGRPALVALGRFGAGVPLVSWSGSSWTNMTSELIDSTTTTLVAVPGSSGCAPLLFVGGGFTKWGDTLSRHVAQLTLCGEPGNGYCFGDGSLPTPCPCIPPNTVPNPSGAPGHGCANSFNLDGARMCAVGTTNPDTVTLRVSGLTPIGFTQFFKGNAANLSGVAFADGVRCADGTILRFGGQNAVLGTAYYPNPALGLNAPLSNAGTPPGSGAVGHYQAIYRNAAANFCTVDTLNVTNALSITWN